jgi:DsbC/DsbD-like thiol-disulfide interchange protein
MRTFAVISLLAIASPAFAQDPVDWTVTPVKAAQSVQAGSVVPVKLTAKIEDGWYIYSVNQGPGGPMPTKVSLPTGQPFTLSGKLQSSTPEKKFDENFGIDVLYHETQATITVPVKIEKTAKTGVNDVLVNARYQVCNASICLPARTEKLKLALNVKNGKPVAKP